MRKIVLSIFIVLSYGVIVFAQSGSLKSVIYDFDGLDIGATDLPDGDYRNNDLNYQVVQTPLVNSDVLGDRALQLDLNWATGTGEFGKNISRFIDLNVSSDRLNFYFYDPLSNGNDLTVTVVIAEDDNSNNTYEFASDDKWSDTIIIHRSSEWQLISLPLSEFQDVNTGGNGLFDVGYSGSGSMLFSLGFVFQHTSSSTSEQYFIDMISFSEGTFPTGSSILDLPLKNANDHCMLGALANNDVPDATPDSVNNLFAARKLSYVNWFLDYAKTGTSANNLPGVEVQHLLNGGYTPVITWEMMYGSYPRLDPVQPKLDNILNGSFDSYIDDFADKIKSFNKTIVLRILHEFEGNWYCWSLTENYNDPAKYISAYRHVVDRFRARGASNVQWMWCVNGEPKPYTDYNWVVDAYPGDNYVDIVATDVYNHPDPGVPFWKSFRYTVSEPYYYLTKHFPSKPFYICEVGCRERYASEPVSSQSKAEWICQMSRDLQSYFKDTRALIFFSMAKEHDWRVNSSVASLNAVTSCVWNNDYFGSLSAGGSAEGDITLNAFPNPFIDELNISIESFPYSTQDYEIRIYDMLGNRVFVASGMQLHETIRMGHELSSGVYVIEFRTGSYSKKMKVIKMNK